MRYLQSLLKMLSKGKRDIADEISELEDMIMVEYGFIPNEVMKKEPIPRIMDLTRAIEKRYKRETREAEKMKRKSPRKR